MCKNILSNIFIIAMIILRFKIHSLQVNTFILCNAQIKSFHILFLSTGCHVALG